MVPFVYKVNVHNCIDFNNINCTLINNKFLPSIPFFLTTVIIKYFLFSYFLIEMLVCYSLWLMVSSNNGVQLPTVECISCRIFTLKSVATALIVIISVQKSILHCTHYSHRSASKVFILMLIIQSAPSYLSPWRFVTSVWQIPANYTVSGTRITKVQHQPRNPFN